jgi:microcystin-dependent protein
MQPTWQAAAGGSSSLITGEYKYMARKTEIAPSWLRCDGRTIGNASSGASARANADMYSLFIHLWAEFADAELPIYDSSGGSSTRGATADYDWNTNNCRMSLPDMRGRVAMMMDDPTGNDAAGVVTGTWADAIGGSGGEEVHTLTTAELAAHSHNRTFYNGSGGSSNPVGSNYASSVNYSRSNSSAGSGAAHNNMQPTIAAGNYFIYTGN